MATKNSAAKKTTKIAAVAALTITLPTINKGEHYAGLVLDENGKPDYHLIVVPGEIQKANWKQATEWAKKQGGDLPSRRELALARVNARQHFQDAWYWSGERFASAAGSAWYQNFYYGYQDGHRKSAELRARAVRRLKI